MTARAKRSEQVRRIRDGLVGQILTGLRDTRTRAIGVEQIVVDVVDVFPNTSSDIRIAVWLLQADGGFRIETNTYKCWKFLLDYGEDGLYHLV